MLANTADTGALEYNTADGTLWFVHALGRHVAVTGDDDLGAELAPALDEIVDHHLDGHALRDRRRRATGCCARARTAGR